MPARPILLALCLALTLCRSALGAMPVRYEGVVKRQDGKPVPGAVVTANLDPEPSILFLVPRGFRQVGRTLTDRQGRFSFELVPSRRLWFAASGKPRQEWSSPSNCTLILTDQALRNPSPTRLNTIEVPNDFRVRTKSIVEEAARKPVGRR